ncbi:MAG: thiamine phosphate synthase [Gammaproteobacteria bacterium]
MNGRDALRARVRGLYAITPETAGDAELRRKCAAALRGGAGVLQYRDKTAAASTKRRRAFLLRALCADFGALFVVNDDLALAAETEADGVHLGIADGDIARAREQCGAKMLLGATCHDDLARAEEARRAGADYCAFGAIFSSQTKPAARRCGLEKIAATKQKFDLPIVAVGGITAQNAGAVFAAGADAVAVCAGLFAAANIEDAARQIAAQIQTGAEIQE